MSTTRRQFMQQTASLAVATQAAPALAAADPKPWLEGSDLIARMSWLNPPASVAYGHGVVTATSKPKTDFWRKTFFGYVTDNGHLFHTAVYGEFSFRARINGQYSSLYDQAGLMVRLDEKQWMKCGSELVDGKRRASVVFTRDFSDWSTMDDLSQKDAVYWRVVRTKDSLEAQISEDGKDYFTIRQGYFPPYSEVRVGVMCASPEGGGFEAVFDDLRLEKP